MAVTPVPPLSDIPTFPALADRASGNYNSMAYNFGVHMSNNFVQELVPVVTSALSNATEAQAQAQLATDARVQTQADRIATEQDRTATAADRVQTNLDKLAAQAAAAQAGTTGAFSDANPVVKGTSDSTKQWRLNVSGLPTGVQRVNTPPGLDGPLATLGDIDRRTGTYILATTNALDFGVGGYVRYAPTVGQAATVTFVNFTSAAAGNADSFRAVVIEGFRLGAATLTWPTINWIKPDGTTTTVIAQAGFTLSTTGIDFVILFRRANDATIYGKVIR